MCPVARCRRGLRRDPSGSALPTLPQSVSRGTRFSRLHWFAFATACQVARPPGRIGPSFPGPPGAFTSRLPAGRSPFPPLDMTTTATGLLCRRDFHPQEWQLASLHRITIGNPGAAIPEHDGPRSVAAFRNGALELSVRDGVVLGPNRKPLLGWIEARPTRYGPAEQNTVEFQAEVVVEAGRLVLLHDEPVSAFLLDLASRLAGAREVPLLVVGFEPVGGHLHAATTDCT